MELGDAAALFRLRYNENLYAAQEPENVSPTCIYRIPSLLRDLDPNAYEPRVVSIGPYHYGKPQLQAMEKHKYRALNRFLGRNDGISLERILAEFSLETRFLEKVRNCYAEPLEPQWSNDNVFSHLMVLDGCFLLDLLPRNYPICDPSSSINDHLENRALLSYVKMDVLVLDNQIPDLVLSKFASIIANLPTGSEDVAIRIYNDAYMNAHHVLDAYRKRCIGTGAYDGWVSKHSARKLYYYGVEFRASSGGGVADGFVARGSFTDVAFEVSDNIFFRLYDSIFYCGLPRPAEPSDQSQNGQAQQNHQNNQNGQALG